MKNFDLQAPEMEVIDSYSEFLLDRPSPNQLLEHLALRIFDSLEIRSALITQLRNSGELHTIGHFGNVESSRLTEPICSVWDSEILMTAVKTEQPHFYASARLVQENLQVFSALPVWALLGPLSSSPQPPSFMLLGVFRTAEPDDDELSRLARVSRLTTLYLILTGYLDSATHDSEVSQSKRLGDQNLLNSLSPRQELILQLLSQGMRNKQIAFTIGYSESLVRQETIEIYRKLGVRGRHEARIISRKLGLVNPNHDHLHPITG